MEATSEDTVGVNVTVFVRDMGGCGVAVGVQSTLYRQPKLGTQITRKVY